LLEFIKGVWFLEECNAFFILNQEKLPVFLLFLSVITFGGAVALLN
jgi:hypothetical protein